MAGADYLGFICEFNNDGENVVNEGSYSLHNITADVIVNNYKSIYLNVNDVDIVLGKCDLEIGNVFVYSNNTNLFWFNKDNDRFGFSSILYRNRNTKRFDYEPTLDQLRTLANKFLKNSQEFFETFYVRNEDGSFNNKKIDFVSTEEEEISAFKAYTKLYKAIHRAIDFIEEKHLS
jgi:hypothetical protein